MAELRHRSEAIELTQEPNYWDVTCHLRIREPVEFFGHELDARFDDTVPLIGLSLPDCVRFAVQQQSGRMLRQKFGVLSSRHFGRTRPNHVVVPVDSYAGMAT